MIVAESESSRAGAIVIIQTSRDATCSSLEVFAHLFLCVSWGLSVDQIIIRPKVNRDPGMRQ